MLSTVWEFLINTPWWVYLILVYLFFICFKAVKTRTLALRMLFILPIIFIVLAFHTLIAEIGISIFSLITTGVFLILGAALGFYQIYRLSIKTDKTHLLIQVPGSWSTLIIVLIIFISKYYFSYEIASNPASLKNVHFIFMMLAISGICTGLFIGRLLRYLQLILFAPSYDLRKNK